MSTVKRVIKTRIVGYYYDTRKPDEAQAYEEMRKKLKAMIGRGGLMNTSGSGNFSIPAGQRQDIFLETEHLFDNQWNATTAQFPNGGRVFDWYQTYLDRQPEIKKGYYLEMTPEIAEIRANTFRCGYCGAKYYRPYVMNPGRHQFCTQCLGSRYLEEDRLKMLRLTPVMRIYKKHQDTPPLTPAELAYIKPLYVQAQTTRFKADAEKQKKALIQERDTAIANAHAKCDGFYRLLNAGINIDNCIFYSHRNDKEGEFCFGYSTALNMDVAKELTRKLRGMHFPYPVELVTVEGKTQI
jgi:hypothetical protein